MIHTKGEKGGFSKGEDTFSIKEIQDLALNVLFYTLKYKYIVKIWVFLLVNVFYINAVQTLGNSFTIIIPALSGWLCCPMCEVTCLATGEHPKSAGYCWVTGVNICIYFSFFQLSCRVAHTSHNNGNWPGNMCHSYWIPIFNIIELFNWKDISRLQPSST